MAANQEAERVLKDVDIESALYPEGSREIVGSCIRLQVLGEPKHPLGMGERKSVVDH
jgi:hypothetical protein